MRVAAVVLAAALIVVGVLGLNVRRHDLEIMDLGEQTRRIAPGSFVRLPQGTVHYELTGPPDGLAVVLVPGFSVPYYEWDPTFAALRDAGFRVLRYDLFGRGLSDRPEVSYNADLFDRQLLDLLNALGISGGSDFVASSMGGPIVADFACRHPERVHRMVWIDPDDNSGQTVPMAVRAPVWGEYTMATQIAPGLAEAHLIDFLHPENFSDWPERFRPQMKYHGFRRALLSTLRDFVTSDWSKDYACAGRTKDPVLLIWGKADREVPFETSAKIMAEVPQAELLAVPDAGHVPFVERPEIVNPALIEFLRR